MQFHLELGRLQEVYRWYSFFLHVSFCLFAFVIECVVLQHFINMQISCRFHLQIFLTMMAFLILYYYMMSRKMFLR
jgi:hypothetical protein